LEYQCLNATLFCVQAPVLGQVGTKCEHSQEISLDPRG